MENISSYHGSDEPLDLPPGFRFHPMDEELITYYLSPKVLDNSFTSRAIGDVDLNKCEPWDLPRMAKMGEKEWYFYCVRDRKYPTGLRTNRATEAGYWKATGKDKEIFKGKALVGMKKTLVFYKGRAPKGEKSNWVMHEYRLEGKFSLQNLPSSTKSEWVICRVFNKSAGGKKVCYNPGMMATRSDPFERGYGPSTLPPLMEYSSPHSEQTKQGSIPGSVHVSCFSNPMTTMNTNIMQGSNQPIFPGFSNIINSNTIGGGSWNNTGMVDPMYESQVHDGFMSEQVRAILESNYGAAMKHNSMKAERDKLSVSQDTCLTSDMNAEISSSYEIGKCSFDDHQGPSMALDIDSFWNNY
ncbi:hypothetical protein Droror1_Dr00012174 [Drosera rotundifolia]